MRFSQCKAWASFGLGFFLACQPVKPTVDADSGPVTETGGDTAGVDPDTSSSDSGQDTAPVVPEGWERPLNEVTFGGTHNSYEVDRGTILEQLNQGIRCLELDIHDNDFESVGDYRLGHNEPGDRVASVENGVGLELKDWLKLVRTWSQANPEHAPIFLVLDLKDKLTDNPSMAKGNLGALNQSIESVFGSQLWGPDQAGEGWPQVFDLRGRVVVQISGEWVSRTRYLRDPGQRPAVAVNDKGQVIEVHDSGRGVLWYWTGQMESDGRIRWIHHGPYDTGMSPAVALDNDGWLVEVHKSENRDQLWAHIAQMNADYTLRWGPSKKFETNGTQPSLQWSSHDTLTEIHRALDGSNRAWTVDIDRGGFELSFSNPVPTNQPRFDTATGQSARGQVSVLSGEDDLGAGKDTLMYTSGAASRERIRYEQLAFVDVQPINSGELLRADAKIFNIASGGLEEAQSWMAEGWLVRMYGFSSSDIDWGKRQPNCPATDSPESAWYQDYLKNAGVLY
jgi:hypothetical protein